MTRERRLTALVIVGLGILCLGLASKAIMSDSPPTRGGDPLRLETSSLDLGSGPAGATLAAHDMAPGDVVGATITISNSGRRPISYAMNPGLVTTGGAALAAALVLTIKTVGSSCADFDGITLFDGQLDKAAFGNEANGRPLAPATAEILCFRAALPIDTGNALQGRSTTIALSFGADLQGPTR